MTTHRPPDLEPAGEGDLTSVSIGGRQLVVVSVGATVYAPPATTPLRTYPARLVDGRVEIDVPE